MIGKALLDTLVPVKTITQDTARSRDLKLMQNAWSQIYIFLHNDLWQKNYRLLWINHCLHSDKIKNVSFYFRMKFSQEVQELWKTPSIQVHHKYDFGSRSFKDLIYLLEKHWSSISWDWKGSSVFTLYVCTLWWTLWNNYAFHYFQIIHLIFSFWSWLKPPQ